MIYLVSRHPGALEWCRRHAITVDHILDHWPSLPLAADDCVIGTLPIHLAAEVCAQGGHYYHLKLEVPLALRGSELSCAQMEALGAELIPVQVTITGAPAQSGLPDMLR